MTKIKKIIVQNEKKWEKMENLREISSIFGK